MTDDNTMLKRERLRLLGRVARKNGSIVGIVTHIETYAEYNERRGLAVLNRHDYGPVISLRFKDREPDSWWFVPGEWEVAE